MLSAIVSVSGFQAPVASRVAVKASRSAVAPQMFNLDKYDDIWSFEAKKECFDVWDPESPRNYDNFNPYERNDEGQLCDPNGCFPGQDSGYKPPNRPDISWDIQQTQSKLMEEYKALPKFSLKGKPGNWKKGWTDGLGPTP